MIQTSYKFSDFVATYPNISSKVQNAMKYGVMHFLFWLDKREYVPLGVVDSVDLLAVEWIPTSFPKMTLIVKFNMTNDMFFVEAIDIEYDDISDALYMYFKNEKEMGELYMIDFFNEDAYDDLPDIVQRRLWEKNVMNVAQERQTLLVYTVLTHKENPTDVLSVSYDFIRDFNFGKFYYDPELDSDHL